MKYMRYLHVFVLLTLTVPMAANGQLASRPAEEWTKTLDADSRVSNLKLDEVVAKLRLKPGETIADIGAGSGVFEVPLAKQVSPSGKVYAVDIDAGFFPEIKKRADAAQVSNVQTVLGKVTDPNLPSKNIDVVFFHDVLHHIKDRAAYMKSVAGYLKTGGRVVVIDYEEEQGPHKGHPELQVTRKQLAALTAGAGLKQTEDVKMFSDKYFLVFSK